MMIYQLLVYLVFLTLLYNVRGDIVILGKCCSHSETFQNGTCSHISEGGHTSSDELLFQQFLAEHPNFVNERERVSLVDGNITLRLNPQPISCPNGTSTVVIQRTLSNTSDLLSNTNKSTKLFPTYGYLQYGEHNYNPKEFCVSKINSSHDMEIMVCNRDECSDCVPKCCNIDQVWDLSLYPDGPIRCRPSGKIFWTPTFHADLTSSGPQTEFDFKQPKVVISHPRNWCQSDVNICSLKSSTKFQKKDVFKILPDGNVWIKHDKWNWAQLQPGTFCLDGGQHFDDNEASLFSGNFADTILIDCTDRSEIQPCHSASGTSNAYAVSLVVASVFLLITVLVYILLWEKQNIHGWTSLAYFASLFAMYIFTAMYRLDYLMFAQDSGYGCFTIAIGAHFFWLSTFCWMSCVNIDLWWTFRSLLPTGKSKGLGKFLLYALFSLGIPSVIVGVGIILDHFYKNDIESDIITPEYGKFNCFMDQQYALLPYLYGPIAVLLSCNLIFFSVTIYDMYKIQQSTRFASMSSSKNPKQKQSMLLFAKLFLLMGIPWGFEVISWATTPCGQISWYWTIFDYINIFQAVAIFFTFVCKSETITSLEAKYPTFKRFMKFVTISPETSEAFLTRHPNLKFIIKPLTRKKSSSRAVSSMQTVSTGADSSRQSSTSHKTHFTTKKSDLIKDGRV